MATKKIGRGKRGGARPGAGRKPTLQRPVRVTLFLDGDVADALERLAAMEDATFSEHVRRVLTHHVSSSKRR